MESTAVLRQLRHRKGWSQRELAEKAGVPQSTVGRIETGALSPRLDTLERLAFALDAEVVIQPKRDRGIDRTLIQQLLRLSPAERIRQNTVDAANLERIPKGRK